MATRARRKKTKQQPEQPALPFHRNGKWGGARPGSGRKTVTQRNYVPHHTRKLFKSNRPAHVTVRLSKDLPAHLHDYRVYGIVVRCLHQARKRFGFRLIHFAVLSNHLHLVCEADDRRAMSRGMQGLLIRLAKALNKHWKRKGSVWRDRYHEQPITSPRHARNALAYVLNNYYGHQGLAYHFTIAPYTSGRQFDGWLPHTPIPPPDGNRMNRSPCSSVVP